MTGEALRRGDITEDNIKNSLLFARGDLFVAASYLGVTARELDGYIRASEGIQAFAGAMEVIKKDANYNQMSVEQFTDRLEQLTRHYQLDGLEEIHKIAMIPLTDSAAMAEVKLKAAVQLRGAGKEVVKDSGQSNVLAELNQLYQANAPRIKSVRVAQIEFQDEQ